MSALEMAKQLGKAAMLDKIRKSGLREYGSFPENLADKIQGAAKGYMPPGGLPKVAGALNNEDLEHILLCVVREHPQKVLEGLGILAYLLDAEEVLLYVPEGESALKKTLYENACEHGMEVRVEEGIADVRYLRGGLISHFITLIALADLTEDRCKKGSYLCTKLRTSKEEVYTEPAFIPYGTKIRGLIPKEMPPVKAVRLGGHLYAPSIMDTQITETTALGDGVITLYTEDCCMAAAAKEELGKRRMTGCGKCTFCREGVGQLYARVHEITTGKGDDQGLDMMKELGEAMPYSSLCSLGQGAARFTMDTLKLFADEYEQHMKKKRCPAGQCLSFINMYIDPKKCTGCGRCIPVCPSDSVEGLPGYIHMIEEIGCTKCGKCMEICSEQAVGKTMGRIPPIPDRLTRVGRFKRY